MAHFSTLSLTEKWRPEIKDKDAEKRGPPTDCHSESVRNQEEGGGAGEGETSLWKCSIRVQRFQCMWEVCPLSWMYQDLILNPFWMNSCSDGCNPLRYPNRKPPKLSYQPFLTFVKTNIAIGGTDCTWLYMTCIVVKAALKIICSFQRVINTTECWSQCESALSWKTFNGHWSSILSTNKWEWYPCGWYPTLRVKSHRVSPGHIRVKGHSLWLSKAISSTLLSVCPSPTQPKVKIGFNFL